MEVSAHSFQLTRSLACTSTREPSMFGKHSPVTLWGTSAMRPAVPLGLHRVSHALLPKPDGLAVHLKQHNSGFSVYFLLTCIIARLNLALIAGLVRLPTFLK